MTHRVTTVSIAPDPVQTGVCSGPFDCQDGYAYLSPAGMTAGTASLKTRMMTLQLFAQQSVAAPLRFIAPMLGLGQYIGCPCHVPAVRAKGTPKIHQNTRPASSGDVPTVHAGVSPMLVKGVPEVHIGPTGGSAARRTAVLAGVSPAGAIPHLAP